MAMPREKMNAVSWRLAVWRSHAARAAQMSFRSRAIKGGACPAARRGGGFLSLARAGRALGEEAAGVGMTRGSARISAVDACLYMRVLR